MVLGCRPLSLRCCIGDAGERHAMNHLFPHFFSTCFRRGKGKHFGRHLDDVATFLIELVGRQVLVAIDAEVLVEPAPCVWAILADREAFSNQRSEFALLGDGD